MSIVLLLRSLHYGGAERQVVELAKGLHSRGHRVLVAISYDEGPMRTELEAAGIPLVVLKKLGRWDIVGYLWRLARLLRKVRPQVLYAFLVEPSVQAVLLKPFINKTRVVWGVRASNVDLRPYGWFGRVTFGLSRLLGRYADLIIANSFAGARYHEGVGYPPAKIQIVPNGIDVDRFRPDRAAGERLRTAWGLPEDALVIGAVGRLDVMKDYPTLLRAFAALTQEHPNLYLVIVGAGPAQQKADLESEARRLGLGQRIVWAGTYEQMGPVYNAFDISCLPSAFGEGFANALGESMACGVPCVATDVGDASRIINGCGIVVPPRDPQKLADALRRTLTTLGDEVRAACRKRVTEEFGLEQMIERTERLLVQEVGAHADGGDER